MKAGQPFAITLRVLETGEFERLGSSKSRKADVRLISATNADLDAEVSSGRFRQDLLFRLNTVEIRLPPLRERRDDIPLLVQHLTDEMRERHNRQARVVSSEVLEIFARHLWPGNVRELRNVIEHAVIVCEGQRIEKQHLPPHLLDNRPTAPEDTITLPVGIALDEAERQLILKTLLKTGNNKTRAADLLNISLKTLHNKLKLYRDADGSDD